MPRKKHKPEEIVAKLRQVDVLTSQGESVPDAIRSIGVSEVTYYRWRQEYGGLKSDQVKRLKDLETENGRLRRAISRAPRLCCTRPTSLDAAQGTAGPCRRGSADRRHHRAGPTIWPLRLSQDCGDVAGPGRLGRQ